LWFAAQTGQGVELWRSDGTAAGTQLFVDLAPGTPSSSPQALTPAQGRLYFTASLGTSGREPWSTDGTPAGTQLDADIVPGATGSSPQEIVALGPLAIFTAAGPGTAREPWRSDGTPAGTFLLQDINPGNVTSLPAELTPSAAGGLVYFAASSPGRTLWATDGSVAGTYLVQPLLSNAGRLAAAFGGVAFTVAPRRRPPHCGCRTAPRTAPFASAGRTRRSSARWGPTPSCSAAATARPARSRTYPTARRLAPHSCATSRRRGRVRRSASSST
jgi:ELWxxDGT repeat protein